MTRYFARAKFSVRGLKNNPPTFSRHFVAHHDFAMARGTKVRDETKAIPASYIRPRDGPDGVRTYNVRAYDPALRKCKTLGTFSSRTEAEAAFRKGQARLSGGKADPKPSSPSIAPTASEEQHVPCEPKSVTRKRPRTMGQLTRGTRTSPRFSGAAKEGEEVFGQNKSAKRRKTRTSQAAEGIFVTPPTARPARRVSGAIRALASAAELISPLYQEQEVSPARHDDAAEKNASDFVTPLAPGQTRSPRGGDMWSRVRAFINGSDYPVPVTNLVDVPNVPSTSNGGVQRDTNMNGPGGGAGEELDEDSPGPAERLAAFLASAARRLRLGLGAAAGLEQSGPSGVSVKTRGMTVRVDVQTE